jgi:cobaltochelatase CobS
MSNSAIDVALRTLENQIGYPSDGNNPEQEIQPWHKELVVQWGVLQGLDKRTLQKSSLTTLSKIYSLPRYRAAVLRAERENPKFKYKKTGSFSLNIPPQEKEQEPDHPETPPELDNNLSDLSYDYIINLIEKKLTPIWDALDNQTNREKTFHEKIITAVREKIEIDLTEQKEKFEVDLNRFKEIVYDDTIKLVPNIVQQILDKSLPRELIIKKPNKTLTLASEPRHKIFDEALTWLETGEHLYLVGPAGTGKTHLGKQLAEACELEFLPMPQALTKYELSGYLDGSGIYRGTIFRQAVEFGGLLVMDEIDINGASAIAFANSVMANGYCAFPDKTIIAHKDLKIVACANTFGRGATKEYIGRNPLDAASLDRFAYLICDYDEDMERMIFGNTPWLSYVQKVRQATQELKLQHIISMRAIARGQRGLDAGLPLEKILFSSLWRGLDRDQINKIENLAGKFQTKPDLSNFSMQPGWSNTDPKVQKLYKFREAIESDNIVLATRLYREANSEFANREISLRDALEFSKSIHQKLNPMPNISDFLGGQI